MKIRTRAVSTLFTLSLAAVAKTGAGNGNAALALKPPAVQTAYNILFGQAQQLQDSNLRTQTLDAISNTTTCVLHRKNLNPAGQQAILQQLLNAGLVDPNDNATFRAG